MDITLVESMGYSVSGRVVAPEGKPAFNALVCPVRSTAGHIGPSTVYRPDLNGDFKLINLFPGSYRIIAGVFKEGRAQVASATVEVGNDRH